MACRPQYISPNVAQPWHLRFLRGLLLDALQSLRREPLCIFGSRVFQSQGYTHTVNWCVGENDGAISADEVCGALDYSRKALAREARRVHFARVKIARQVKAAMRDRKMHIPAELAMEQWIFSILSGQKIDVQSVIDARCDSAANLAQGEADRKRCEAYELAEQERIARREEKLRLQEIARQKREAKKRREAKARRRAKRLERNERARREREEKRRQKKDARFRQTILRRAAEKKAREDAA